MHTLLIKHWFCQGQTSLYILVGHLLAAAYLRESPYTNGGFSIFVKTGIISNEINLGNYWVEKSSEVLQLCNTL